jgi:hypothetical protein
LPFTKYYQGCQIKEDEMEGSVALIVDKKRLFTGKLEGTRSLWKSSLTAEDNME